MSTRWPEVTGSITRAALGCLLCVLAAGCAGERQASQPLVRVEHGVVDYVSDGDTLRLRDGRIVRLVQIDAPELETGCYGRAAWRALRRLASPGTRVTLERDPALDDVDRYGRLLRYVVIGDQNGNLVLVAAGAAVPYFFHNRHGRIAGQLLRAARAARAQRRGLWGACVAARLEPGLGAVTDPA